MAYWNSSETSITLSGLKRNGMSRSNVGGLVAFSKVFRSDRLTNLIPGYTIPVCLQFLHPLRLTDPQMFLFSRLSVRFSPLPPLFFLPPFSRACARNGRISSSKNRGRKTREGMTRGKRKTRILSCFPPPPRSSTRAARLSVTRPRFRGIRYGGGGEEDVVAEDVDRRVNSL